jgi:demethylmacrocin O-methyltransferase
MRDLTPLCQLARKHETDKGGRHMRYGGGDSDTCHEYTPIYWDLLSTRRDQVRNVLEIGINAGSSLRMWAEFFPKAFICGIDCDPRTLFTADRIRTALADQNNPTSLMEAIKQLGVNRFDLIIDDGSHEEPHQIVSLQTLAPLLAPDGIYVVEDLQIDCHPERVGDRAPAGFAWQAYVTEMGIGKAHCPCNECGGKKPEQLLVIRRKQPGAR